MLMPFSGIREKRASNERTQIKKGCREKPHRTFEEVLRAIQTFGRELVIAERTQQFAD
jgi:hypothetical protein